MKLMIETLSPRTSELAWRAKSRYSDAYAYHDWKHAEDVMRIVANIADMSIDPYIQAHKDLLVIAGAWHDVDYHIEDLGEYESKELRSADLAARMLPELSDEERDLVTSGIIDTTVEKHPKSGLFGEVLHAADIGYLADDTDRFMERLGLMRVEWGSPDWKTTVDRTCGFGLTVVEEMRPLMQKILKHDEASQWISNIEKNLAYLQAELYNGNLS